MTTPKLVYIAGPYSGPPWRRLINIYRALRAAVTVMCKGHVPWCPHTHTCLFWICAWGTAWEEYMRISKAQVLACDWLLYLGPSTGADLERGWAADAGNAVFTSADDIPCVTDDGRSTE